MGLVERKQLIEKIVPPFEHLLATKLVDEFIGMERRFIQRDWEPANLDGGQFAEAAAKILYQLDSGANPYNKEVGQCIKYIENNDAPHHLKEKTEFRNIRHLARVIAIVWQFRSERGAVHISATYSPNHMDSKFLIESVRWCMNEFLRIFWNGNRDEVAKTIRELLQFDVPCIGIFSGKLVVQRVDLKPAEEVLLLLHFAGEEGLTRTELGKFSMFSPSAITNSLSKLSSKEYRQITSTPSAKYVLTDLGNRRVRENLSDKLLMQ